MCEIKSSTLFCTVDTKLPRWKAERLLCIIVCICVYELNNNNFDDDDNNNNIDNNNNNNKDNINRGGGLCCVPELISLVDNLIEDIGDRRENI